MKKTSKIAAMDNEVELVPYEEFRSTKGQSKDDNVNTDSKDNKVNQDSLLDSQAVDNKDFDQTL